MKKTLLFAIVAAGALTLAANGNAADPVLSPRGKAQADSLRTVPGTSTDLIDRSVKLGSPRGIAMAESLRNVPSTASTAVASAGYRATGDDGITASPRFRQQLGECGAHLIVAPLK
jgi:hypothetical protein